MMKKNRVTDTNIAKSLHEDSLNRNKRFFKTKFTYKVYCPKNVINKLKTTLSIAGMIVTILLSMAAAFVCSGISWVLKTWNHLSMDELMYQLNAPIEGTNEGMVKEFLNYSIPMTVLILFLLLSLFIMFFSRKKIYYSIMGGAAAVALITSALTVHMAWNRLDAQAYVVNQKTVSDFIGANYVDPSEVTITFPEQKRNLIYIFLESMEMTYADLENGGAYDVNYIPELTQLAQQNEDFSGTDMTLNGGYALPYATWTVAGMFAQTAGLPLEIPIGTNAMDTQDSFFPEVTTIGDILARQGYNQSLLIGSDATFGGRRLLFSTHGDYEMWDYIYAAKNELIPAGHRVWWGYEDWRMVEIAKAKLLELSAKEQPFNLTMLTVDTHFEDGYICELCPNTYEDNRYANVITCSDHQVSEFVKWIQQQDFYENTTIVISGDHPTMDGDFCKDIDLEYQRRVYTCYINAAVEPEYPELHREFSTFDEYPTTLAAMGAIIEGDRLGLGTNLFSDKNTLLEQYGLMTARSELQKNSEFMNELASGINTSLVPTGTITALEYDNENKVLPVLITDVANVPTTAGISIAHWSKEDQADLSWTNAVLQKDGSYFVNISVDRLGSKNGAFILHAYMVNETGRKYLLGASRGVVRDDREELEPSAANITVHPYDPDNALLQVWITDLAESEASTEGIQIAYWLEDDQSDLQWMTAECQSDGVYFANIDIAAHAYRTGTYHIHAYLVDQNGDARFIGEGTGIVE